MTKRFFRQLMTDKVRYLLISGQATVLYGASTFSEDVDIWLDHEQNNVRRFLSALRKLRARYYKLTPPMTPACLRKGHGFHFVLTGRREADWSQRLFPGGFRGNDPFQSLGCEAHELRNWPYQNFCALCYARTRGGL